MSPTTRLCPVCQVPMQTVVQHRQEVDQCPRCGGRFYDAGELESMLQLVRCFEEVSLDEPDVESIPDEEVRRVETCPVDGAVMEPQDIAGIVIDRCPRCQGLWLDRGEVVALKIAEDGIRQHLNLYLRLGR
ncbi:MAG TPA: zf-TFIIB domain-containing protein [Myxococcota bacterium]|nr:zf-TFIIB domain-containing protein [Myxococcota bacterium]HQK51148.1 zf-TFIIB domain-containing protein [Myxococcota bacterium]